MIEHSHSIILPKAAYGAAIETVYLNDKGELWVDNLEYASQVNYCPICGFKAPIQVEIQEIKINNNDSTGV